MSWQAGVERRRTCSVVAGHSCHAPANSDRSTRGTCFGCGCPVCLDEWCSRLRVWGSYGRRRICRNCDENGAYEDPAGRARLDRRLAAS